MATNFLRRRKNVKKGTLIKIAAILCAGLLLSGVAFAVEAKKAAQAAAAATHPELTAQEKLIDCAECHKEATPELEKQWYDSGHGLAMVKCYQCHGTAEKLALTPPLETCAACHAEQINKCPQDKTCWQCHIPHSFAAKK
jgi:hypothetical protein